jgi:hypothetical protein
VVRGWTAVLDPALDGETGSALVLLAITTEADADALEAGIAALPAVVEVLDLSGPWDYQVRVRFAARRALRRHERAARAARRRGHRDTHRAARGPARGGAPAEG